MEHDAARKTTKPESTGSTREPVNRAAPQHSGILRLQSLIGNQAVARLIQRDDDTTISPAQSAFREAQTLYDSHDYAGAFQAFQRVAQMPGLNDRQYLFMLYNMGMSQLHLNNLIAAQTYLRNAVRMAEEQGETQAHAQALRGLENVQARMGEQAEADGPPDAAEQAVAEAQDQNAQQLFEQAREHFDQEAYTEALAGYQQVAAMGGLPPRTHIMMLYNIGQCHFHLGQRPMAIHYLEEFLIRAQGVGIPVPPNAIATLADLYSRLDRSEAAEMDPDTASDDAAGEAEARALFRRAQQAHDSENFGEAAALFRQLYHRTDLPPRIHRLMLRNLGISLYRLGNIEEALVFLNMYIAQRR